MKSRSLICLVAIVVALCFLPLFLLAQEKKDGEEVYTIKKGDTLWDISAKFLKDPFLWPKLWQRNPYITNPHWIYPGNPVRLSEFEEPKKAEEPKKERPAVTAKVEAPAPEVKIEKHPAIPDDRDAGFMSSIDYPGIGVIVESREGKNLMAEGDILYVTFKTAEPVVVGNKYTIFRPSGVMRHPLTGEKLGRKYNIMGNIKIIDATGNFFTAKVTESFYFILKGDRLQPYNKEKMDAPSAW